MVEQDLSAEHTQADADWTIQEIRQQPKIWSEAVASVRARRGEIEDWLRPILAQADLRIVLTGAGSSAYIGEVLAPQLTRSLGRPVEAVSTTSLVADPRGYLVQDRPTLLISFGRSGNSPESVAAIDVANACAEQCHHLIICCNPDSDLTRMAAGDDRYLCVLMPIAALDQSFAMTSSFSSMLVSVLAVFAQADLDLAALVGAAEQLLTHPDPAIFRLTEAGFDRIVFLGAGSFQGIACEAALKTLELGAGQHDCYAESPLGLRHGPKFVIDRNTLVVMLVSDDPYTRRYDLDLLAELERDQVAKAIIRLDWYALPDPEAMSGIGRGLVYLLWCQLFAYHNALHLGINPDNPSPNGRVNRVVEGVVIYPLPENRP